MASATARSLSSVRLRLAWLAAAVCDAALLISASLHLDLAASSCGEVGGAERHFPQPVVVVLGPPQVQRERLVEQAEPGEGLFQPIDRLGGGREDLVKVVGGGVVGGAFGDGGPLLAFAQPVQEVRAGQHELVAGMAVQVPRAGTAVHDGLVGAEPALGRGAGPAQVN